MVSDEAYTRKDIITLQDPQSIESRDFSSFKHVKDGDTVLPDSSSSVNKEALGNAAKILKAKEAVAKARAEGQAKAQGTQMSKAVTTTQKNGTTPLSIHPAKQPHPSPPQV